MINVVKVEPTIKKGRITIRAPFIEGLKDDEIALVLLAKQGNKKIITAASQVFKIAPIAETKGMLHLGIKCLGDAVISKLEEKVNKKIRRK